MIFGNASDFGSNGQIHFHLNIAFAGLIASRGIYITGVLGEGRYFKVHVCPDFLNDAEFFRVSKFVREF